MRRGNQQCGCREVNGKGQRGEGGGQCSACTERLHRAPHSVRTAYTDVSRYSAKADRNPHSSALHMLFNTLLLKVQWIRYARLLCSSLAAEWGLKSSSAAFSNSSTFREASASSRRRARSDSAFWQYER